MIPRCHHDCRVITYAFALPAVVLSAFSFAWLIWGPS